MFIILGGTGHVGSAVARALLAHGQRVTIVTHNSAKPRPGNGAAPKQPIEGLLLEAAHAGHSRC